MIDLTKEKLMTMAEAAALLPGRPSLCALWRWRKRGLRGQKLESLIIGGRPYTSAEALQRFARHQGATDPEPQGTRSPCDRERAIRRAERELKQQGI